MPWPRLEPHLPALCLDAAHEPATECDVHPADERASVAPERVERAVPEHDLAVALTAGLEPRLSERCPRRPHQPRPLGAGPDALPGVPRDPRSPRAAPAPGPPSAVACASSRAASS